jgi:rSAM/selenodomain-associated transferase 2
MDSQNSQQTRPGQVAMELSVIIPARDEQDYIGPTLERVMACPVHEVIVVDGGSSDQTAQIARSHGASVITAVPGRGGQQHAGALAATGDTLLFLHADTLLPNRYDRLLGRVLAREGVAAGAFGLKIDALGKSYRFIERTVDWRSHLWQMPYGDQGLFMRADAYHQAGGFGDSTVMEDYALVQRLRKLGRVAISPAPVLTSARRWRHYGIWRMTLINQLTLAAYHLGASPARIEGWRKKLSNPRVPVSPS